MVDGPSLYKYACDNPVVYNDPTGHFGFAAFEQAKELAARFSARVDHAVAAVDNAVSNAPAAVGRFARDALITTLNEFSRAQASSKAAHNAEQADVALAFGLGKDVVEYRKGMVERFERDAAAVPPPPDTPGGKTGQILAVLAPVGLQLASMAKIARQSKQPTHAEAPATTKQPRVAAPSGARQQAAAPSDLAGKAQVGGSSKLKEALSESLRNVNNNPKAPLAASPDYNRDLNCANTAIATDATLAGNPASALPGRVTSLAELTRAIGKKRSDWVFQPNAAAMKQAMRVKPEGTRAIVFGSRGKDQVGHYFNATVSHGKVTFVDGQTGGKASLGGFESFRIVFTN
jgi:hypothetical protein